MKAEVAAAVQASAMRFEYTNSSQSHNDVMFSLDDFEGKFTELRMVSLLVLDILNITVF